MYTIRVSIEAIDETGMRWLIDGGDQVPQLMLRCVAHNFRPAPASNQNIGRSLRANNVAA